MPGPIETVAELATELAALFHNPEPLPWERVLAGLAALRGADLAPLGPVVRRAWSRVPSWRTSGQIYLSLLTNLVELMADPAAEAAPLWQNTVAALRQWRETGRRDGIDHRLVTAAPDGLLVSRLAEIGSPEGTPLLLATPTHVNGSLDAGVLLDRLRQAHAEGWAPLPADFAQALLRVPRAVDPGVAVAARAIPSAGGRRFADWLDGGGLPDLISTRYQSSRPRLCDRPVTELRPAGKDESVLVNGVALLLREDDRKYVAVEYWQFDDPSQASLVPWALPHHREAVAAWLLTDFSLLVHDYSRGRGAPLVAMAECDGPAGPAVSLALAYGLGAQHAEDRAAAVDAFLLLAATPGWAPGAGIEIAALADLEVMKLGRVVSALTDAHVAGAGATVWEVLAAAIPALVPSAPRGLPDLLELASRIAAERGLRGSLPGVEPRKGSSRLVKELNRLHALLTGPSPVAEATV